MCRLLRQKYLKVNLLRDIIVYYVRVNQDKEVNMIPVEYVEFFAKYLNDNVIVEMGGTFTFPDGVAIDFYELLSATINKGG